MMTAEQIIAYLEAALAEAYDMHDEAKGKDAQRALACMIRAYTIKEILDHIR